MITRGITESIKKCIPRLVSEVHPLTQKAATLQTKNTHTHTHTHTSEALNARPHRSSARRQFGRRCSCNAATTPEQRYLVTSTLAANRVSLILESPLYTQNSSMTVTTIPTCAHHPSAPPESATWGFRAKAYLQSGLKLGLQGLVPISSAARCSLLPPIPTTPLRSPRSLPKEMHQNQVKPIVLYSWCHESHQFFIIYLPRSYVCLQGLRMCFCRWGQAAPHSKHSVGSSSSSSVASLVTSADAIIPILN